MNDLIKYQCSIMIKGDLERITRLFTDHQEMHKWEDGLEKVELLGPEGQNNTTALLYFKFSSQEMIMKETIEENRLPNSISIIYEVDGAWNRCINYFYEKTDGVLWVMDSEFAFKEEINIPLDAFIKKTQIGMEIFKNYVERTKGDKQ